MPIYKISRRGAAERRSNASYRRLRLVAVLLSCLFISVTIMLLSHGWH